MSRKDLIRKVVEWMRPLADPWADGVETTCARIAVCNFQEDYNIGDDELFEADPDLVLQVMATDLSMIVEREDPSEDNGREDKHGLKENDECGHSTVGHWPLHQRPDRGFYGRAVHVSQGGDAGAGPVAPRHLRDRRWL